MSLKRLVLCIAGLFIIYWVVVGLSRTCDIYVCRWCGISGRSKAIRICGIAVWKTGLSIEDASGSYQTYLYEQTVAKRCNHTWYINFTSSHGLLFNPVSWDGPVGRYGLSALSGEDEILVIAVLGKLKTDEDRCKLLYELRLQEEAGHLHDVLSILKEIRNDKTATYFDIISKHGWPSRENR